MRINVLSVTNNTFPGKQAGTSYQQLEVVFKNIDSGKVDGKKIVSFGKFVNVYNVLKDAQSGDSFTITTVKDGNFWNWSEAVKGVAEAAPGPEPTQANTGGKGYAAPKSNYETPEERAKRQVLIVRQSSLSAAVATLKLDKAALNPEDVLTVAEVYSDWVFQQKENKFSDIPDDIPY